MKYFTIYMDDGIIHTYKLPHETEEEHLARHREYVHTIFDILEENDLYLKPEKCLFEQQEIDYLGIIIGNGQIKMDPSKIKVVKTWPTPTNLTEIWAFLVFTSYYRYFIKGYSAIARPLLNLTKKGAVWHWGQLEQSTFKTLWQRVCDEPVLQQPNFNKQFYLQTDTSAYRLEAVLSQEGGTSHSHHQTPSTKPVLHPVAYYSAIFTPTERNYDIYERELLAVMKSLSHWRPYLGWTKEPFIIWTNHANLQYWKSPRNLNCCTTRWHADLQEYDFQIEYIPGKTNVPSDFLSRPPTADRGKDDNQGITIIPPERCKTLSIEGKTKIPPILEVKRGLMNLYHNSHLAGHPGQDETLRKLQEKYWWPNMRQWVEDYIKGCATCQQNKILTHRKKTPLYRIPTLPDAKPFQQIALDLITGLPLRNRKDAILTIVDQGCSRAAVFLSCSTTITGPQIAQLYLDNVYQWFGLPTKVISDQDPRFTSSFGRALTKKLGIEQNLSSAFHPQTDSLLEWKNQWIEQYLRIVTSLHPTDWTEWISIASIVHNNRRNATTGLAPNQILLGYGPTLNPLEGITSNNQSVEEHIAEMTKRHQEAIQALNQIACTPTDFPVQFPPGSQVWLEATNLCLPFQTLKLNAKRYGPFKVLKALSPVAYQLELPVTWRIHNTFHASLLTPYLETLAHGPNFSRPPPDLIDGEEEQEVERILDHHLFGRSRKLQYLIKWKGFPDSDNEWVSPNHMHAPDLVWAYHKWHPLSTIKALLIDLQTSSPLSICPLTPLISPTNPWRPLQSNHPCASPHPLPSRFWIPSTSCQLWSPLATRYATTSLKICAPTLPSKRCPCSSVVM